MFRLYSVGSLVNTNQGQQGDQVWRIYDAIDNKDGKVNNDSDNNDTVIPNYDIMATN